MNPVSVITARSLTEQHMAAWRDIIRRQAKLDSPFFYPEFTQIVARHRPNVCVAISRTGEGRQAFLPFEKRIWGIGQPVGGQLSDYHGIITSEPGHFSSRQLIRGAGLQIWKYNHGLKCQAELLGDITGESSSPVIDICQGMDVLRAQKAERFRRVAQGERRLERDHGPVSFSFDEKGPAIFDAFVRLKRAQAARKSETDILQWGWAKAVLKDIHMTQTPAFAGTMSVLYAGSRVAAIHFGMRTASKLHYWFPAYDPCYAKFSPGLILLLKIIECMPERKLQVIDLGKGAGLYKSQFMNGEVQLLEGYISRSKLAARLFRSVRIARDVAAEGRRRIGL